MPEPLRVVALISGRGSNLQALIDAGAGDYPGRVVAVVSNEPTAAGLERGRRAGIPTAVVAHRGFDNRHAFETSLATTIDDFQPDLVVLAGFMRILSAGFVERYPERMMNIHPSLLPAFPGLHTHRRALQAGVQEHGATVHFVTPELDAGPIILQAAVPVETGDDESSLAARVLSVEHRIYPQAVRWFAEGRLRVHGEQVLLDGTAVSAGVS